MTPIPDLETLESLFEAAVPASLTKVVRQITPPYATWIAAARFCVLSTVGPEGTDGSPRGDDGPVVRIIDPKTIWLPDWRGNNRIDSLRNIVRDGRVSLMFMVPGSGNVVRVNGRAVLTADPTVIHQFQQGDKHPKVVIVVTVAEVYFQCAKAILRSALWGDLPRPDLPTAGQFVKDVQPDFDAESYDNGYAAYAKTRMW